MKSSYKWVWNKWSERFKSQILPSIIVLIAFLVVTLFSWQTSHKSVVDLSITTLAQKNNDSASFIRERIATYEDILRGEVGLFNINNKVTRQEWSTYLNQYDVTNRYPGIYVLVYVAVIQPNELEAHIQQVRAEGFKDYTVFPAGSRQLYTSILYIDPFNASTSKGLGYDMYTDATRHAAMDMSRDDNIAVVSSPVTLVQDIDSQDKQPGFIMYMPIYKNGASTSTVEDRRANIDGFVTAAFRSHDLVQSLYKDKKGTYGFQILDITTDTHKTVYKSPDFDKSKTNTSNKSITTDLYLPGAHWQIEGLTDTKLIDPTYRARPTIIFWTGMLFSFIMSSLIYMLLVNRAGALAKKEENNIQEAKDELLALASHQLRTPATGVKQYVGILREGLAGDVTPLQQSLLDKAHDSNERQLTTINEMLFVARTDAGHLKLEMAKIDVPALIRDILQEQKPAIVVRKQKLQVRTKKKHLYVYADKQYFRMALENVISNASKYTATGGVITIESSQKDSLACISIKDNGVGVEPSDQERLFKKFSRIPNQFTGHVSGSGIGLYLAKKVVELHNGTIEFVSDGVTGSEVTIRLPLKR
jgi:signal transduction histidine kinase